MYGNGWHLENVELRARRSPTFIIPSLRDRCGRSIGDLVRLVFAIDGAQAHQICGERMWVEITAIEAGIYRGRLANHPAVIADLQLGDPVRFGPEHIAEVYGASARSLPVHHHKLGIVTADILDGNAVPGVVYRGEPVGPRDSGWVVISFDADDAYLDDIDNLRTVCLHHLVDIDPSLASLFSAAEGARFIRGAIDQPWRAVAEPRPVN